MNLTDANAGSVKGAARGGMEREAELAFRVDGRLLDLHPTLSNVAVDKLGAIS